MAWGEPYSPALGGEGPGVAVEVAMRERVATISVAMGRELDPWYEALGGRIRDARRARGWTQTRLADLMGVRQPSVSDWENGVSAPDPKTLWRLAEILHVPLLKLYGIEPAK